MNRVAKRAPIVPLALFCLLALTPGCNDKPEHYPPGTTGLIDRDNVLSADIYDAAGNRTGHCRMGLGATVVVLAYVDHAYLVRYAKSQSGNESGDCPNGAVLELGVHQMIGAVGFAEQVERNRQQEIKHQQAVRDQIRNLGPEKSE